MDLVIRLSGRHMSSICSGLRKYAIGIYVGIRCDVDVVSDAKVVHCTSSLRLVESPRRRQRSMLAARSFGNHRNSPDSAITSFISFRSRGFKPLGQYFDIVIHTDNSGLMCTQLIRKRKK
jgi:hypothetical protein